MLRATQRQVKSPGGDSDRTARLSIAHRAGLGGLFSQQASALDSSGFALSAAVTIHEGAPGCQASLKLSVCQLTIEAHSTKLFEPLPVLGHTLIAPIRHDLGSSAFLVCLAGKLKMQPVVVAGSGKAALLEDSPALSSQGNEAAGTSGQRPVTKRATTKLSKGLWSSSKGSKAAA